LLAAGDVQHARRRTSMPLKTSSSDKKTNPEHIGQHGWLHESSVVGIVNKDLSLKCLKWCRAQELTESNRLARLVQSRQLLKLYQEHYVAFMWFTDEKIFTVAVPSNSQNNHVYAACDTLKKQIAAKRLLWTRNTFSQSIMAVWSCFSSIQAQKINGAYYRDILLRQKLLPAIWRVSGKNFIFQQDSAPAHHARETLKHQTSFLQICGLQNSPDLNPVDYEIWAVMQRRVLPEENPHHRQTEAEADWSLVRPCSGASEAQRTLF